MKQYILVMMALGLAQTPLFAQEWTFTPINVPEPYYSMALSADGRELAVGSTNGVYISNDSGATWTLSGLTNDDALLFFFGGGNELHAGPLPGVGYLSTTNSGATWTPTVALTNSGWLSGGQEWPEPPFPYSSMSPIYAKASSADGTKWAEASDFPGSDEYGDALVIGLLYTTADSGGTWNQILGPTNNMGWTDDYYNVWRSLVSSADGTKLAAGGGTATDSFLVVGSVAAIYTSTNSGVTWTTHAVPTNADFCQTIACSADGNLLFVSANDLYSQSIRTIYRLQSMPTPLLTITSAGTNVLLSWVIPSMSFTLQQSPDLTIWTDVTNTPVPNNTNLHNEIIIPPPANGTAFYRLKF